MPNINLLPWRERLLQEANRQFFGLWGFFTFICLILLGLLFFYLSQVASQVKSNLEYLTTTENQVLQDVNNITDLKKKRVEILTQLKTIQAIFINKIHFSTALNSLAQAIPEGLVLFRISLKDKLFRLEGVAQNNDLITKFMNNLPFFGWFQEPELLGIKSNDNNNNENGSSNPTMIEFILTIKYKLPTLSSYDNILNETTPGSDASTNSNIVP